MEVKSLFMNLIQKTYEKQDAMNQARAGKNSNEVVTDNVTISHKASSRLFQDIMEHSLQKGLNEVQIDEN